MFYYRRTKIINTWKRWHSASIYKKIQEMGQVGRLDLKKMVKYVFIHTSGPLSTHRRKSETKDQEMIALGKNQMDQIFLS